MPKTARLNELVVAVRHFMPDIWRGWHREYGRSIPSILSTGTCGRTSLLLRTILISEGFNSVWRNGAVADGGGFFNGHGWHDHAWVLSEGLIVDITADQFNAPSVIVAANGDFRYRETGFDPALPEWRDRREQAAQAAFLLWLDRGRASRLSYQQ